MANGLPVQVTFYGGTVAVMTAGDYKLMQQQLELVRRLMKQHFGPLTSWDAARRRLPEGPVAVIFIPNIRPGEHLNANGNLDDLAELNRLTPHGFDFAKIPDLPCWLNSEPANPQQRLATQGELSLLFGEEAVAEAFGKHPRRLYICTKGDRIGVITWHGLVRLQRRGRRSEDLSDSGYWPEDVAGILDAELPIPPVAVFTPGRRSLIDQLVAGAGAVVITKDFYVAAPPLAGLPDQDVLTAVFGPQAHEAVRATFASPHGSPV